MKFRCVQNSIRLRLRRSEVDQFHKTEHIKEQIGFPGGTLIAYEINMTDLAEVAVLFESGKIDIHLPKTMALKWITTNQVGINHELPLPNGHVLSLLIEKDFPCKTREDEDKADHFEELVPEADQVKNC